MTKLQKERTYPLCALFLFFLAASAALPARTFKTLVTFNEANGEDVFSSLIEGSDGNLYGSTVYGGKQNFGTIFKLTLVGKETVLYNFCLQSGCPDGTYPGWLTQASDGNFYSETYGGGTYNSGTIFKITPTGQLTTLYSFCAQSGCPDGALPQSALVQASDGNFYGTTVIGGAQNQGTVFKITSSGVLTTLYSFCSKTNCTDGTQPNIGLTLGSDGNFYGTTALGGKNACPPYGCGTAFKITSSGVLTTLYTFCSQANCADGNIPQGLLVQAKDGNFYGTTDGGGANSFGTAFKMNAAGKFKTLHSFCVGSCSDGGIPYAGLIQGTDGNFYGTAAIGGAKGYGAVYKMSPTGKVVPLHAFDNNDGFSPAASLFQASDGNFYGGTEEGGNLNCFAPYGCGTVFRISAP
jgi:uncharacterized repeat protein (TIGR03803 family)